MRHPSSPAAPGIAPYVASFLALYALWLLLVGNLRPDELIAGAMVAALTSWLAGERLRILSGLRLSPAAPLHAVAYLAVFSGALLRANVDVARRVLAPSLPINPALVRVTTGLESDLGRLLLANSITLTPGTLSVDVEDGSILVHWIDQAPGIDLVAATGAIAAGFERHIRGFLR